MSGCKMVAKISHLIKCPVLTRFVSSRPTLDIYMEKSSDTINIEKRRHLRCVRRIDFLPTHFLCLFLCADLSKFKEVVEYMHVQDCYSVMISILS